MFRRSRFADLRLGVESRRNTERKGNEQDD
jgi:hypothetical protein